MIVKSHPRKTASFAQLLSYINRPGRTGPAILHNLLTPADRTNLLLTEFRQNARHLTPRRNGNVLYHEILSFSGRDGPHLTLAVLEDLTRRYIALRCPNALVYARAHFDTEHPHVHLIISANNIGSTRPHRLSRQDFHGIKQEMELYQRQHYPELSHSVAQTTARHPPETRAENELVRRLAGDGRLTRKQEMRLLVEKAMTASNDQTSLEAHLLERGLALYRRGRTVGVVERDSGRRHRLGTLGLLDRYEELMAGRALPPAVETRLADLSRLRMPDGPERGLSR